MNQETKTGWTPLLIAAAKGNREVVTILLQNGAKVDQAKPDDTTPLFFAAQEGYRDVVEILIKHGADKNIRVKSGAIAGLSPLDIAAKEGNERLIPLLKP